MISIDILLVTYNQEQYIQQALDGILMQRVNPDVQVRIVVADDCSTDKTLSLITKTLGQKTNIASGNSVDVVYLPAEKNLGIAANYKRAIAATTGDYIAILEGDDYWISEMHIMQHVKFLEKNIECSMSMNRILSTKLDGAFEDIKPWRLEKAYYTINLQKQIMEGNQLGNLSACCFRGKYVRQLPQEIFNVHVDDFLLGIMMAMEGNIAVLQEPTSVYRCNPNSMWASLSLIGKFRKNLQFAYAYDMLLNRQYHALWKIYKRNIFRELLRDIKHEIAHKLKRMI